MARRGMTLEHVVFYGALAYGLYLFLTKLQARGVTIIPPDEPAQLTPAPSPVTLDAIRVGSGFKVQR